MKLKDTVILHSMLLVRSMNTDVIDFGLVLKRWKQLSKASPFLIFLISIFCIVSLVFLNYYYAIAFHNIDLSYNVARMTDEAEFSTTMDEYEVGKYMKYEDAYIMGNIVMHDFWFIVQAISYLLGLASGFTIILLYQKKRKW